MVLHETEFERGEMFCPPGTLVGRCAAESLFRAPYCTEKIGSVHVLKHFSNGEKYAHIL